MTVVSQVWNWNLLTRVGSVNMSLFVFVLPFLLSLLLLYRVSRQQKHQRLQEPKWRSESFRAEALLAASCRFTTTFQASSVLCRGQRGEEECRVSRFLNWRDASKTIRKDRRTPLQFWTIFPAKIMEKWIKRGIICLKWKYCKRWQFCLVFCQFLFRLFKTDRSILFENHPKMSHLNFQAKFNPSFFIILNIYFSLQDIFFLWILIFFHSVTLHRFSLGHLESFWWCVCGWKSCSNFLPFSYYEAIGTCFTLKCPPTHFENHAKKEFCKTNFFPPFMILIW